MRVKCRQFSGRPLSNTLYPDVFLNTLDAGGRVVPAHRIVLASLSSTAKRIFEEGKVRPRDVVTLKLPSFKDLTCLVKFVYTGSLKVKDKNSLQALRSGLQLLGVVGTFKGDVQDILNYVAGPSKEEMALVQSTGVLEEEELDTGELETLAIKNISMERKKPSNSVGNVPLQFLPLVKKMKTGSWKVKEDFSGELEEEELETGELDMLAIENTYMERKKPSNSVITHILNTSKRKKNNKEVNQGKVPQLSVLLKKINTGSLQFGEDFSIKKALPMGWMYPDRIPASLLLSRSPELRLGRRPYSLNSRPLLQSTRKKSGPEEVHQGKTPIQHSKAGHRKVGGDSSDQISPQPTVETAFPASLPLPPCKVQRPRPRSKTSPRASQGNFKPAPGEKCVFSNVRSDSVKVQCKLCPATPTMTKMRFHVLQHELTITQYKTQHGSMEPIQRIYHKCGLCGVPVLLDSDEIHKHLNLKGVMKHGDTSYKDYYERFLFDSVKSK